MPRKLLKRLLPDSHKIRKHKHLQIFGEWLHDPNLWHLNRRSVAGAVSVGLFVAFVPIPFQMVLAAAIAILLNVNLPIAVSLVWVTNPFTIPPLFYFAYVIGGMLLRVPTKDVHFALTMDWLMTQLGEIWEPFLLGCLILATSSALLGNILMRSAWRMHVISSWKARREMRRQARRSGTS